MQLRSSVFGWKSVWMELAEETKGEFIDKTQVVIVRVPVAQRNWTITFMMHENGFGGHSKQQTVVALPFFSDSDFVFAIHNKNWLEETLKNFGWQDIVIGDPHFDPDYIIQGNDERMVKKLLQSEQIKDLIKEQKTLRLRINAHPSQLNHFGHVPSLVHILSFQEEGSINSFERLRQIYNLMITTAEELCRLGVARPDDPGFVI